MYGPAWPLCLLLCFVVLAVYGTLGKVIAPASLIAEAGQPLTLSCNYSTTAGDTIHQVRWLNKHSKTILAYEQSSPIRVSHQDPNIQHTSSQHGTSYITIKKVKAEDEGCYHCIFDVFPKGQQEEKICVTVTGKVHSEGNKSAIAGKPTSLSCNYTLPEKVHQVLWRRKLEQGDTTTIASYSIYGHQSIEDMYRGRVSLNRNLRETQLDIKTVKVEDEACYTCEFHTYPDGTKSAMACLSVYVLPKPEINYITFPSGSIEANCSVQSRPSAQIAWNVGEDNRTLGPPQYSSYDQEDGTTIVTSTVLLKAGVLSDVKCIVHHRGLDKPLSLSLTNVGPAMVVLLSVCGVVSVLLLCLCACLCKCFVCNDD